MNDRLTNEQLRQAIRETWTDTQRCVGADRDAAVLHLNALRVVESNRAWSLISAAGEQEKNDGFNVVEHLAASCSALLARAEAAEARASDLQAKLDAAARLARETAGEAMGAVRSDSPVIVIPEGDWRRLVELVEDLMPLHACEDLCDCCADECEIKAIIERTEKANG